MLDGQSAYRYIDGLILPEDERSFETKRVINNSKDYLSIGKSAALDHCSYLFPEGKQWCLIESEDIQQPILGCNEETAEKLLKVVDLEYFDISPETNINML